MIQQWKKDKVKEIGKMIEDYKVIGILDMCNLPAAQLQNIKKDLRGKALVKMTKKRIIKLAMDKTSKKEVNMLIKMDVKIPALIFSEEDPFKLARILGKSKSPTYAKAGDISPRDIVIPAGPTNLPPGPAISDLQKAGVKAIISGNNISVKEDSLIAKEGDEISDVVANVLMKLDVKPMEIGLNLLAVYEEGTIYNKDVLFVDEKEYLDNIKKAYTSAFNLAYNAGYPTKETVELLVQKVSREVFNLALEAEIITKDNIDVFLQKAQSQALALKSKIPEAKEEKKAEEPKEEKEAEEKEVVKEKSDVLDKNKKEE